MKYRLKDCELHKKLDEISDGDFSAQLELEKERVASNLKEYGEKQLWFGDCPLMTITITPDMLEEVPEYNPHEWNSFPEVDPPEDVLMRCEWIDCDGIAHHFAATCAYVVNEFEWYDDEGREVEVSRFRPWEDEE